MALFKIYRGDKADLPGGWNETTQKPEDESKMHDGYAYFCADTGEFFIDVDLTGDGSGLKRVQINALAATKLSKDTKTVEIDEIVLKTEPIVRYDASDGKTLTLNAVLVGNNSDTVKLIPATLGAFFVNEEGGAPKFDVLPVAQGGTGANKLVKGGVVIGNDTGALTTESGIGVLYAATENNPTFTETLPISAGGTGAKTAEDARDKLEVYSKTEVDTEVAKAISIMYPCTLSSSKWNKNGDEGGYVQSWLFSKLKCGSHDTDLIPPEITFTVDDYDDYEDMRTAYGKIKYAIAERGVGIKFYIEEIPDRDIKLIIIDQM